MSISATYKTEIVIPKPQLTGIGGNIRGSASMRILELAARKIAKEHGGTVTGGYRDCDGMEHDAVIGVASPELPNGLGIQVDPATGCVSFEYDRQGANPAAADRICGDLARAYAVVAVMEAQKRLANYRVEVVKEQSSSRGRTVVINSIRQ